jgi:hypothetical protein
MELFRQINYEALNEDARLKRQIRDRTFEQVAAFTQSAAEQIKPAYGADTQNTFDKIYNNFGSVLAQAIDDYQINDNRINAADVIRSYNNLSSFINSKMGFKDLTLTQRDYITQKMNVLSPQVGALLQNAQAADYTDKFEVEQLLNQLRSKTYNTVGYASIRPEFLDLRGLIGQCRQLISLIDIRENNSFFEAGEKNIIETSNAKIDQVQAQIFDNPLVTGGLKRQFDLKNRDILEKTIRDLTNLLGSVENRKALTKKLIKDYTDYEYIKDQMGRNATVLAESNPRLLDQILLNSEKLSKTFQEALGQSDEPYKAKKIATFSKSLKVGTALLEKAGEFYTKIVKNTVAAESPKQSGDLALPKNMQAVNGFTYANENPDPEFAAPSDNIVIQDFGPTPSFTGSPRGKMFSKLVKKVREAEAVPAAEPLEEPMIGEGLRSHPSYKNVKRADDVNPYIRMFAR